jgi:glutaconate CoA-transferase subunit B
VAKLDFVTSVGHYKGGTSRTDVGLDAGGPFLVVTDKAIFDFDPLTKETRLSSIHPGIERKEVLDSMGFRPVVPEDVPVTLVPSRTELNHIRNVVDPNGVLLRV